MSVLIRANTPEEAVHAVRRWLEERAAFEEATHMEDNGHKLLRSVRVSALRRAAEHLDDVVVLPTKE
jgi:hypothetical protein